MKAVRLGGGYTVIETLIFLAISSVLFFMAYHNVFSNRGRTEFTQGVRDFENQLIDIMNDVDNGYYPYNGTQNCTFVSPNGVSIGAGSTELGSSGECVFAGRVITTPIGGSFTISTLVAPRQIIQGGVKKDLEAITDSANVLYLTEDFRVPYSIKITDVERSAGPAALGIGFVTTFTARNSAAMQTKGTFTKTQLAVFDIIPTGTVTATNLSNASQGVFICIKSETSNQKALVRIGGTGQQLSTASFFDQDIAAVYGGCTP